MNWNADLRIDYSPATRARGRYLTYPKNLLIVVPPLSLHGGSTQLGLCDCAEVVWPETGRAALRKNFKEEKSRYCCNISRNIGRRQATFAFLPPTTTI